MHKISAIALLAGLLSGCVTSNEPYASSGPRMNTASRHADTTAVRTVRPSSKEQTQVILGAAY